MSELKGKGGEVIELFPNGSQSPKSGEEKRQEKLAEIENLREFEKILAHWVTSILTAEGPKKAMRGESWLSMIQEYLNMVPEGKRRLYDEAIKAMLALAEERART